MLMIYDTLTSPAQYGINKKRCAALDQADWKHLKNADNGDQEKIDGFLHILLFIGNVRNVAPVTYMWISHSNQQQSCYGKCVCDVE